MARQIGKCAECRTREATHSHSRLGHVCLSCVQRIGAVSVQVREEKPKELGKVRAVRD